MECSVRVSPHHSLVRRSHNPSPLSGFSCHRKTEPPTLLRPLGSWWANCDLETETRVGLSWDPTPSAWGILPPSSAASPSASAGQARLLAGAGGDNLKSGVWRP